MIVKELGNADTFGFGKYKGQKIQDIWESDKDYVKWSLAHINEFSIPLSVVKSLTKDCKTTVISFSEDLIEILKGIDKVGAALLKLNNTEICGDITNLKLSDSSEKNDVIAYRENEKGKWTIAKIGKVINKILTANMLIFSQSDVERFINSYKARLYMKNVEFELVSGKDIKKWYSGSNYESSGGTLYNSCMKYDSCQGFLKIYTRNDKQVNLLIMKNKNGVKIIGRALVWLSTSIQSRSTKLDNVTFMDRIYYSSDFQVNLFVEYAKSKGWAYKEFQNHDIATSIIYKDKVYQEPFIKTKIKHWDFDKYPYVDSIPYVWKSGVLSNKEPWIKESDTKNIDTAVLRHTDGGRSTFYNYSY